MDFLFRHFLFQIGHKSNYYFLKFIIPNLLFIINCQKIHGCKIFGGTGVTAAASV
jgi:hypothetical protein